MKCGSLMLKKTTGELTVKAYAKINLALDVVGKRSDGYHEVVMIMQSVNLYDQITLREKSAGISLTTDHPELCADESNLAYRAATCLKDYCRVDRGVHLTLEKHIPLAAGLAGGSSDAAAVLLGLNKLWGLSLTLAELSSLAAKLGSDVPFCLTGGTMLATGRGEILAPLPPLSECYVILVKPPVSVSTAWVYGQYRGDRVKARPDIAAMRDGLGKRSLEMVAAKLQNVLETVTCEVHPEIGLIKSKMLEYGAMASLMSGSGPTVFGLTPDKEKAKNIFEKFKRHSGSETQIYLVETIGQRDWE